MKRIFPTHQFTPRPYRVLVWLTALAAALILSACSMSLAADVTPPPDFNPTQPPAQPVAQATARPIMPPDPQNGASIFVEKCAPCHGETGMGDGSQADGLPNPATALGDPQIARDAVPAEWFRVVTEGNLDRFMPPFTSLTDRQRWDVVAYALNLGMGDAESQARGKTVYDEQCAVCHGADGRGVSADAPDWKVPGRLTSMSQQDLFNTISQGAGSMPAFSASLSEENRWDAAAYVRNLSFNSDAPAQQAAADSTPQSSEQPAAEGALRVNGDVKMFDGSNLPQSLQVRLQVFDGMTPVLDQTQAVNADGSYSFVDVPFSAQTVMVSTVDYDGLTFNSEMLHDSGFQPGDDVYLPVTLYDTTTDTSGLNADRLHVFFDFTQPDRLQVVEMFLITNRGDQVVAAETPGDAVVRFKLPPEAENLQFQDGALGARFVQTEDGFGDTISVLPGTDGNQILFAFDVPYDRKYSLKLEMPLQVDAVVVGLPADGVRMSSPQLNDNGERSMQGMNIHMYGGNSLAAGSILQMDLSGKPNGGAASLTSGSSLNLIIGLGAFGLVLMGIGLYFVRQRRQEDEEDDDADETDAQPDESQEALLDAILALDDRYQAGDLPEEAYRQRRNELKARLRALSEKDSAAQQRRVKSDHERY